jgi:predicted Fe-Mo cluster-binding NifX family protein
MIKIAVALCGDTLAEHFGRTERFAIFTCPDAGAEAPTTRVSEDRSAAPHAHSHHEEGSHGSGGEAHPGHHEAIVKTLEGCQAVIAGGMGHRVAIELTRAGIEPVVAAEPGTPEELVRKLLRGELRRGAIHRCCHGA